MRSNDDASLKSGPLSETWCGPSATAIYNAGLSAPLPSLSLVACSKTNYLPTDITHRIVVTFTQIAVG